MDREKGMQPIIKIENLVFEYKDAERVVRAVDDVSLDIRKGEFLVVIGHNGSGKSTLAKHLNAILLPTEGHVYVGGMDTLDPEKTLAIRQMAGMVYQNPDNQLVATVVEEDVAFGPENLGIEPKEIRRRVDEALKAVRMDEFAKKAPHLLSGGQKQRIAIAGIIAMRPDCIILDEPTAMLDPRGRNEVMETIERLNREEKITIVHITHFMEEAVRADRVCVMDGGKIIMQGTPREIFKEVDTLKKIGLDVPQMTELSYELRKEGIEMAADILTVEEMVNRICR